MVGILHEKIPPQNISGELLTNLPVYGLFAGVQPGSQQGGGAELMLDFVLEAGPDWPLD